MADRSRQPPIPPPRRAPPVSSGGVSRNLFQSRLTRRPTPVAGSGPQPSSSAHAGNGHGHGNGNGIGADESSGAEMLRMAGTQGGDGGVPDIVVRDRNGDIVIGELPMAGVLDEEDEGVMHDQEESKRE